MFVFDFISWDLCLYEFNICFIKKDKKIRGTAFDVLKHFYNFLMYKSVKKGCFSISVVLLHPSKLCALMPIPMARKDSLVGKSYQQTAQSSVTMSLWVHLRRTWKRFIFHVEEHCWQWGLYLAHFLFLHTIQIFQNCFDSSSLPIHFQAKSNISWHIQSLSWVGAEPTRQFRSIKKWHVQPNYPGVHEYMESYGEFALSFTIMCHNFDHVSSVIASAGNQH